MDRLLFGTAGVPHSSKGKSTQSGIERIAELGLGCMEVEFVRGVKMGLDTARAVGETASRLGIRLSAHGPYWINLNSAEETKVTASRNYILQTARATAAFGGRNVNFPAAFNMGKPPVEVYAVVKAQLKHVLAVLKEEGIKVWVRPEVMGRDTQFGSLDELLRLSKEMKNVMPCIDFAHLHARSGKLNTRKEFVSVLKQVESALGRPALEDIAIHVSGIEYTKKGEKKHLNFKESDFQYRDFVRALKDCDVRGMVICECPNLEEDALLLQNEYREL